MKDIRGLRCLDERHVRNGRELVIRSGIDCCHERTIDPDLRIVRIGNHSDSLRQPFRIIVDDEYLAEHIRRHEVLSTFVATGGKPAAPPGNDGDGLRRSDQRTIDIGAHHGPDAIGLSFRKVERKAQPRDAIIPKRGSASGWCRNRDAGICRRIKIQIVVTSVVLRNRHIERIRAGPKTGPKGERGALDRG